MREFFRWLRETEDRIGMDDALAGRGMGSKAPLERSRGRAGLAASVGVPSPRGHTASLALAALTAQAAECPRGITRRGEPAPGATTGESDLRAAAGMSHTPSHEGPEFLATERPSDMQAHHHARVARLRAERTGEPFEPMAGIERIAAELAEYPALGRRLCQDIVAAAGDVVRTAAQGEPLTRAERVRCFALSAPLRRRAEAVDEHRIGLAALKAEDPERAGRALERHMTRTGGVVRAALPAGVARCASSC